MQSRMGCIKLKSPTIENNYSYRILRCIYILIHIYKPDGNHTPKICTRYTQRKKRKELNVTLRIIIKALREESKRRNKKEVRKTIKKQ